MKITVNQMTKILNSDMDKSTKAELFNMFVKESVTPSPVKKLLDGMDITTKMAATISSLDNPTLTKEVLNVIINYGKLIKE